MFWFQFWQFCTYLFECFTVKCEYSRYTYQFSNVQMSVCYNTAWMYSKGWMNLLLFKWITFIFANANQCEWMLFVKELFAGQQYYTELSFYDTQYLQ